MGTVAPGRAPRRRRRIAALAWAAALLTGCQGGVPGEGSTGATPTPPPSAADAPAAPQRPDESGRGAPGGGPSGPGSPGGAGGPAGSDGDGGRGEPGAGEGTARADGHGAPGDDDAGAGGGREEHTTGGDDAPGEVIFTILSAGDVLPHHSVNVAAQRGDGSYDYVPLMSALEPWTAGADLALCSLEVPLAPPGEPVTAYPVFGAPQELVHSLAELGWDGCSTATNHALDRGLEGAAHTLDVLDAVGLGHVGTARRPAEAAAPQLYELERAGRRVVVAHIAATSVVNGPGPPAGAEWALRRLDVGELIAQAAAARAAGADVVVASLHWGTEYVLAPVAEQVRAAQALAGSGEVDLVLGAHPHVAQPLEELPGGPGGEGMWVAWSMGNFISNQDVVCCVMETATGVLVTATVRVPARGDVTVEAGWTAVTVDRAGGQRVHLLHELAAGARPPGLTLDPATIGARAARVTEVMGTPERTEPPRPTGPGPRVVGRD
ncbi:CapA family protein [Georgenia sp. AZ-5]|uniref:CapA family protein n=1 Tax=Georgenia sp. AZ-5 TaxID=3367526 RepID=UPI003754479F